VSLEKLTPYRWAIVEFPQLSQITQPVFGGPAAGLVARCRPRAMEIG
jgi:hypothetical protein